MVTDQENPEKLGKWKSAKCVGDLQAFVCKRPAFGAKYIYFHDLVDQPEAKARCADEGMTLARIQNEEELVEARFTIAEERLYIDKLDLTLQTWIGLEREDEDTFRWSCDGSEPAYTNWWQGTGGMSFWD